MSVCLQTAFFSLLHDSKWIFEWIKLRKRETDWLRMNVSKAPGTWIEEIEKDGRLFEYWCTHTFLLFPLISCSSGVNRRSHCCSIPHMPVTVQKLVCYCARVCVCIHPTVNRRTKPRTQRIKTECFSLSGWTGASVVETDSIPSPWSTR